MVQVSSPLAPWLRGTVKKPAGATVRHGRSALLVPEDGVLAVPREGAGVPDVDRRVHDPVQHDRVYRVGDVPDLPFADAGRRGALDLEEDADVMTAVRARQRRFVDHLRVLRGG